MTQTNDAAVASSGGVGKKAVLLVFIGLMVTELLSSLNETIFATALPTIVGQLHVVDQMQWVMTAYLLTSTIALPVYGKMGDLIGRKGLFLGAIAIFIVGSTLGGFAGNMTWLIIGRAVQGIGGGGLIILSDTIVADVVPARKRGRYMGIIGSVLVLSSIAGPLVGGWLTDGPGWRWGLWMNIPLGILAIASAAIFMRLPKIAVSKPRMDWAGMGLLAIALTCLVLVTTWGGTTYDWGSVRIVSLIVAAVVVGVLFVLVERHAVEPVMPLTLFKDRNFNLTTIAGLIIGIAMFGTDGYMPTYLQMVTGVNATQAGLFTLPLLLALIIVSIATGELVNRTGHYKWLPITGATIVAVSLFLLSRMTPDLPIWVLCSYLAVMGIGLGACMQILVVIVQNSFPASMVGTATASNNYFRQIGALVGASIVGSLFAARLVRLLADQIAGGVVGGSNSITPELVKGLPQPLHHIIVGAYNDALTPIFLFILPIVVIAVILLCFVVEKPLATTIEHDILPESLDGDGGDGGPLAAASSSDDARTSMDSQIEIEHHARRNTR